MSSIDERTVIKRRLLSLKVKKIQFRHVSGIPCLFRFDSNLWINLQWARERRDQERERDSDFGPEDYFEGALQGGIREEDVDEFGETMLLVLLCLTISILLYIRTRIVERMRREQRDRQPNENQQDQGNPNGVFPPPGDPARADWAVLR